MRQLVWYLDADGASGIVNGANSVLDLLADARTSTGILSFRGHTVTRIIGDIYFRADAVPALDSVQEAAFGIGVFDANLADANHPNPRSENHDWMWQKTVLWVPWTVEASAGTFRQLMQVLHFDVLTQRRLKGTEDKLELMLNNVGSEDLSWNVRCRILLRAP